jgi:Fe(3+) dicitrate transport protein
MVGGKVDDVWLLSARSNFNLTDKLTLFVAGTNLTDELYIADLSDGAKPGQGRTIYGGFTLKFD